MPDATILSTIAAMCDFKELNAMTRRYLKIVLVGSLFTLSACAQQSEVREMKTKREYAQCGDGQT